MATVPTSLHVSILRSKAIKNKEQYALWEKMRLLYVGGMEMQLKAAEFLTRKPKEMSEVYATRLGKFSYNNHAGTAVDYYLAATFEEDLDANPAGDVLKEEDSKYYETFWKNCDKANTPLRDKLRDNTLRDLLLYGRAALLVDLPGGKGFTSLLAQKQSGALDPYLTAYEPQFVTNWATDENGILQFVVFQARTETVDPFAASSYVDKWYMFTTTDYYTFERAVPKDETVVPDEAQATLVDQGPHALSSKGIVPVVLLDVPGGMWLMNRAYLTALDHINTDNVLGFALWQAALVMPYIKSASTMQPQLAEAGYLQLGEKDEFGWTEPEGKSFGHLATRARTLVEDIYRAFYLLAQARSTEATPAQQSGFSKELDMSPSQKVLNLFGGLIRNAASQIYDMVSAAREDGIEWNVTGLEHDEGNPAEEMQLAAEFAILNVPSDTAEKEMYRRVVYALFPYVDEDVKAQMIKEINEAASAQQRQLALEEQSATIQQRVIQAGGTAKTRVFQTTEKKVQPPAASGGPPKAMSGPNAKGAK